jgi:hypothetical protein
LNLATFLNAGIVAPTMMMTKTKGLFGIPAELGRK